MFTSNIQGFMLENQLKGFSLSFDPHCKKIFRYQCLESYSYLCALTWKPYTTYVTKLYHNDIRIHMFSIQCHTLSV